MLLLKGELAAVKILEYNIIVSVKGELAAVKILESIHEIIEEIEEEYKILMKYGHHANMPKFYGLFLKTGDTGSDDQLWFVMEVSCIGVAPITQLCMCIIKIVTFKGGHLMWQK